MDKNVYREIKYVYKNYGEYGWCIFGPTPIPSSAHPTYEHVVLTAVVGPMHCRSDGHIKNSISVHPTYVLSCRLDTLVGLISLMGLFRKSDGHFS